MKKSLLLFAVTLVLIISSPSFSLAQQWSPVGDFTPEGALPEKTIEFEGDLIVCAEFTSINGEDLGHIIRWDGTSWSQMGGNVMGDFKCMGVANGELFEGGILVEDGQSDQQAVYKWNGTTWIGTGNATDVGYPFAMTEWNGQLVVAARGSGTGNTIQQYDGGTTWTQIGPDVAPIEEFYQDVNAIAVYNDELYIAGDFDNVGALEDAQRIAKFDGQNWVTVNFPMPAPDIPETNNGEVQALIVHDGKLFAAGFLYGFNDDTSIYPSMASYDGSSWTPYEIGDGSEILCLESDGENLYCGGNLLFVNGDTYTTGVVVFDENETDNFIDLNFFNESEFSPSIRNLTMVDGSLFASGQFLKAGPTDVDVWGMTEFDGVLPQPTAINEINRASQLDIELFPNPATDYVTIELQAKGKITILNSLGAIVYEENTKNSTTIDVSNWDFGVYYIQYFTQGNLITKKMVKM